MENIIKIAQQISRVREEGLSGQQLNQDLKINNILHQAVSKSATLQNRIEPSLIAVSINKDYGATLDQVHHLETLLTQSPDSRTSNSHLLMTLLFCKQICKYQNAEGDHPYLPRALKLLSHSLQIFRGTQYLVPLIYFYAKLVLKYKYEQCYGSAEACLQVLVQVLSLDSQESEESPQDQEQAQLFYR